MLTICIGWVRQLEMGELELRSTGGDRGHELCWFMGRGTGE